VLSRSAPRALTWLALILPLAAISQIGSTLFAVFAVHRYSYPGIGFFDKIHAVATYVGGSWVHLAVAAAILAVTDAAPHRVRTISYTSLVIAAAIILILVTLAAVSTAFAEDRLGPSWYDNRLLEVWQHVVYGAGTAVTAAIAMHLYRTERTGLAGSDQGHATTEIELTDLSPHDDE